MRNLLRSAITAGLLAFIACVSLAPRPAFATVDATPPTITYSCNGASTAFVVPFTFQHAGDLVVSTYAVVGGTHTLSLGTDYAVQGVGSSYGGTIITTVAPASGMTITIIRLVSETQPFSFRSQSYYNPALHEQAFDWLEYQIQQVSASFGGTATSLAPGALFADSPIVGDGSASHRLGFDFSENNVWTGQVNHFNNVTVDGGLSINYLSVDGGLNVNGNTAFDGGVSVNGYEFVDGGITVAAQGGAHALVL